MPPNGANTCLMCLKASIDITEDIEKQITVYHCKECNRYRRIPKWTVLEPESPQLLTFLLKHIKGLNKSVKLIDSSFIWTEPHSRRIKIKLTVQKEVEMGKAILQKQCVVEFIVQNNQCDDCKKTYTPHSWVSQVQVRQKVTHKRTFLFLE